MFYDEGVLQRELALARVPTIALGKRGRWDIVGFLVRLIRVVRQLRPQVVYAFLVEPSILALVLKPWLSTTRIVWGVRASDVDLRPYGWFPRVTFRISCWLARFADLVIANSVAGAEYHTFRGYPATRLAVVANGFDLERFRPNPEAGRRMRTAWRIPVDASLIGVVGRIDPIKDHASVVSAAAILRRQRPDCRFVFVGDSATDLGAQVRAQAEALGLSDGLVWVGLQDDMPAVYNALDVLCSASLSEGFPNVLGEAMACGVPCVASDVGDSARLLDSCGVVVPPRDPVRLAEAICQVLVRTGPDLKRACRERIEQEFSVDRMVTETEQLLRDCIDAAA